MQDDVWKYDPACACNRCARRTMLLTEPSYPPVGCFILVSYTIAAAVIATIWYLTR